MANIDPLRALHEAELSKLEQTRDDILNKLRTAAFPDRDKLMHTLVEIDELIQDARCNLPV